MNRKFIEKGYGIVLDVAMLILGIAMVGFFFKDLWNLGTMVLHTDLEVDFYAVTGNDFGNVLVLRVRGLNKRVFCARSYFITEFYVYWYYSFIA